MAFIDRMKQDDKPPQVALACAKCGEKVMSGQEHKCQEGGKNEDSKN